MSTRRSHRIFSEFDFDYQFDTSRYGYNTCDYRFNYIRVVRISIGEMRVKCHPFRLMYHPPR